MFIDIDEEEYLNYPTNKELKSLLFSEVDDITLKIDLDFKTMLYAKRKDGIKGSVLVCKDFLFELSIALSKN